MTDYPYMLSNKKIAPIIEKIQQAARPQKFTLEVLRSLGFTSTNDRAFIPLFKKLGFFADDGTPTAFYDQLKDVTSTQQILAARIKDLYSELYAINTEIHKSSEAEIKGAISRVTGRDADGVGRIYNTFKTLCDLAEFDQTTPAAPIQADAEKNASAPATLTHTATFKPSEFHYNIQIHLPATNDISVYNAIFKSLKENLLM